MSSSEAYILNEIQTPNALNVVYNSISDGNMTEEDIEADTCLPEGSLSEVLSGLVLLGLIRRTDYEYEAVDLDWDTGDSKHDFRLTALGNLAEEATPGNWGKQAVVLLNYEYLIRENIQEFENNEAALYESIDNWLEKNTDYRPKSGGTLYDHNDPKFGNWTRLVYFLGLVHKISGRQYSVYPNPEMVLASIERAAASSRLDSGDGADIEIREYLRWLNEHLLRIGYEDGMSVPAVLARTLFTLVRMDHIRLIEYGDSGAVPLDQLSADAHRGIDKEANSIKIL